MFRINDVQIAVERFPDGTPRLNVPFVSGDVRIEWLYEKDEEMILFFIVNHIRDRYPVNYVTLYMPYIPHARMDRTKNEEEVFTLKYFCDLVNSMKFDKVIVRDAHSVVSLNMLDNVIQEPIDRTIKKLTERLLDPEKDIVFYPDEGSSRRYSGMIPFTYAYGMKKRDWDTGKIIGLDVLGNIPSQPFNVLIIDDISSYGGTFLHSSKKLREMGAEKIYLYVTHCENSVLDGEMIRSGYIEKIYTTRSIYTGNDPMIEVIGGD